MPRISRGISHCDVNRCYGYHPRWMTGRVSGGRGLSRSLAPADWLCRNVTGHAPIESRARDSGNRTRFPKKNPRLFLFVLYIDGSWINKMDCYCEGRQGQSLLPLASVIWIFLLFVFYVTHRTIALSQRMVLDFLL